MHLLVLDTNVALDLLVFRDPSTAALDHALASNEARWIATAAMRDELARVLGYPQVASRMLSAGLAAQDVLGGFDRRVRLVDAAPVAAVPCRDPDDQPFIDLAVQHRCTLLSKDAAVLALRRRLEPLQVIVRPVFPVLSYSLNEH
jgi:predicted nucleic acid-binding protein